MFDFHFFYYLFHFFINSFNFLKPSLFDASVANKDNR